MNRSCTVHTCRVLTWGCPSFTLDIIRFISWARETNCQCSFDLHASTVELKSGIRTSYVPTLDYHSTSNILSTSTPYNEHTPTAPP